MECEFSFLVEFFDFHIKAELSFFISDIHDGRACIDAAQ